MYSRTRSGQKKYRLRKIIYQTTAASSDSEVSNYLVKNRITKANCKSIITLLNARDNIVLKKLKIYCNYLKHIGG